MEVVEHEHPLCLIDMQPDYPQYEEEYDDETDDLVRKQVFQHKCDRCKKEINWFHRYYYKCGNSCDYLIHKSCAELPLTLTHTSHSEHNLILFQLNNNNNNNNNNNGWCCGICGSRRKEGDTVCYQCFECNFKVDVHCAMSWAKDRTIYHPSHQHPLVATLNEHIRKCDACGDFDSGIFYLCTTCVKYFIHSDCALMPELLSIQQATKNYRSHPHLLTLSYSFPREYQEAEFDPPCRVCNKRFHNEKLWIYKCEKCRYYAHLDCTKPGAMTYHDYELWSYSQRDFDNKTLVGLPFPDETSNVLKHRFFKETGDETCETSKVALQYSVHQHPLILVHPKSCDVTRPTSSTSTLILCHNPMKKLQLLCNGCLRPITSMPFYKCANYEDQQCNFVLHEWCTRLPDKLKHHPGHPEHTLTLYSNVPSKFLSVFTCGACSLPCNGFVYSCVECDYHIDVNCGFMPQLVAHEAHERHIFRWIMQPTNIQECILCLNEVAGYEMSFRCFQCGVSLHTKCAVLLPSKIQHKYDKHILSLSYLPIENHKGRYFCEICEEELNPRRCFYHCEQCAQSIHSCCAPFILESETATSSNHDVGVYEFVNIKFGGIHKIQGHPHALSLVQGTNDDGKCSECDDTLRNQLILKCLQCKKFALDLKCSEQLSTDHVDMLICIM